MASKGGLWGLGYGRRRGITVSMKSNGVHRVVASRRSATPHEPRCSFTRNPLQLGGMTGASLYTLQDGIDLVFGGPVSQNVR